MLFVGMEHMFLEMKERLLKGFDANVLYVWNLSQDMPTSKLKYEESTENKDIIEVSKTTFGFFMKLISRFLSMMKCITSFFWIFHQYLKR